MSLTFRPFSDFAVVVGIKGGGKSVFTRWYAKQLDRFLMLDPTRQNSTLGYVVYHPQQIAPAFQSFKKVIYQPQHASDEYAAPFFATALHFCNYTLIIDEVDEYLGSKHIICSDAKTVIVRGRNQGIGGIFNTRRPHDINKCIRSNADHVVTFQMNEEDDLKYMAKWIDKNPSEIKALKEYHSFYYNRYTKKTIELNPCPLV